MSQLLLTQDLRQLPRGLPRALDGKIRTMKVTIHFNNGMTFASIGYGLLLAPMFSDDSSPLLIETMFP
jgi:hypothetical protein